MSVFFSSLVTGLSMGAITSLVALSYVVVYRSTHTLNFAQGSFLALGGYLAYFFSGPNGGENYDNPVSIARLPLYVALILSMIVMAVIGLGVERIVIRRFRGKPIFAALIATLGVGIITGVFISIVWGTNSINLRSPFADHSHQLFGVPISDIDAFTMSLVCIIGLLFFFGFERSKLGNAMSATFQDPEAAIAQGISPSLIYGVSWAISGALAAVCGVLISSGAASGAGMPTQLSTSISSVAFYGFPAIVLGGLDSTKGAVAGGIVIGLAFSFFATYAARFNSFLGVEFYKVSPLILMVAMLLIRPSGFFGSKQIRRV